MILGEMEGGVNWCVRVRGARVCVRARACVCRGHSCVCRHQLALDQMVVPFLEAALLLLGVTPPLSPSRPVMRSEGWKRKSENSGKPMRWNRFARPSGSKHSGPVT